MDSGSVGNWRQSEISAIAALYLELPSPVNFTLGMEIGESPLEMFQVKQRSSFLSIYLLNFKHQIFLEPHEARETNNSLSDEIVITH